MINVIHSVQVFVCVAHTITRYHVCSVLCVYVCVCCRLQIVTGPTKALCWISVDRQNVRPPATETNRTQWKTQLNKHWAVTKRTLDTIGCWCCYCRYTWCMQCAHCSYSTPLKSMRFIERQRRQSHWMNDANDDLWHRTPQRIAHMPFTCYQSVVQQCTYTECAARNVHIFIQPKWLLSRQNLYELKNKTKENITNLGLQLTIVDIPS